MSFSPSRRQFVTILSASVAAASCYWMQPASAHDTVGLVDLQGHTLVAGKYQQIRLLPNEMFLLVESRHLIPDIFRDNTRTAHVCDKQGHIQPLRLPKGFVLTDVLLTGTTDDARTNGKTGLPPDALLVLRDNNKFALADIHGRIILPAAFCRRIDYIGEQMLEVVNSLDPGGHKIFDLQTRELHTIFDRNMLLSGPYEHGVVPFRIPALRAPERAGLLDRSGKIVFAGEYWSVAPFDKTTLIAQLPYVNEVAESVIIDRAGKELTPRFSSVVRLKEGLATANLKGRIGYIDSTLQFSSEEPPGQITAPKTDAAKNTVTQFVQKDSDGQLFGLRDHDGKVLYQCRSNEPKIEIELTYAGPDRVIKTVHNSLFDAGDWKNNPMNRQILFSEFLKEYQLIGMPREKVLSLLGTGDISGMPNRYTLSCWERCGNTWKGFDLDYENDKVKRWRLADFEKSGPWVTKNVL